MENFNSNFNLKMPIMWLNCSRTRSLQLIVETSGFLNPEIKFKLAATDHKVEIIFKKSSWDHIYLNRKK